MISVAEAQDRILAAIAPVSGESVSLARAGGRVLADAVMARRTQPPVAVSAMDGYAVRATDVATVPATLTVVGSVAAGTAFAGEITSGQAVRIFTGAPLPKGADTIVIQENTESAGKQVVVQESATAGTYVRRAGLDFLAGDVLLRGGTYLGPAQISLAAAMNAPWLRVRRRPRIALISTGDELVMPGEPVGASQIISSNALGLAAMIRAAGAEAIDLGIAHDNKDAILELVDAAKGADLLITLGGASVGDHDLVQAALAERGLNLDFWKIAMRPGKPLMFGHIGEMPILGLPGNPVSSLVCGLLFVKPVIAKMLGQPKDKRPRRTAKLGRALGENDQREDYLRATLSYDETESVVATPFSRQDSSMLSKLSVAQCLIIRPPLAPAAPLGTPVPIIELV